MDLSDPNCDRVRDGSLIVALDWQDGKLTPRILYADAKQHDFWDCTANEHVSPPRFYLPVSENPGFDPVSGLLNKDRAARPPTRKSKGSAAPEVSSPARPHEIITDRARLDEVALALSGESALALDIETYGPARGDALDPWKGDIRLLQLAGESTSVFLLDLQAIGYDLGPLADLLASKLIIGHNLRFDARWLQVKCGLRLPRLFCTLTAARLLAAGTKPGNNLDQCLERYCGIAPGTDESRSDWGGMLLTEDQLSYATRDVAHLHLLKGSLDHELEMSGLDSVFDLESRLLPVVIDMEIAGMAVDTDRLRGIESSCRDQAAAAAAEVRDLLALPELNIGSPKQLLAALNARGIPVVSTNEEALRSCGEKEIVPKILASRALEKQAQQAASLLDSVASDGRIHGQFDPMGTATGRFSSKTPNLQNIGRGDLRSCFVARKGRALVIADYSQVELRVAAAIAGEKKMIDAYNRGEDLHRLTASVVLGKPLEAVTKDDRQLSKAVNFGLLYGQHAKGLVRYAKTSYGVTLAEDEALAIRQKFFATYGHLRQWHGQSHVSAEKGVTEVRTVSGRRRLIDKSATDWERFTALVNTPVQGGCADGLKQALVDLSARLPEGAKMISTVHDEIIVECEEAQAESVREILQTTMREAMATLFPQVPIEVEAGVCSNWGDKP
jgi:DNA polymerase I-like protein with 3'-5' exonuclease and polymerase domains